MRLRVTIEVAVKNIVSFADDVEYSMHLLN